MDAAHPCWLYSYIVLKRCHVPCVYTQTDSRGRHLTSTGSEEEGAGAHCAVSAIFLPTTKPEPYFPGVALDIDGHGLRGLQPSECPCVTVQT